MKNSAQTERFSGSPRPARYPLAAGSPRTLGGAHPPRLILDLPWMKERARLLHRICLAIQRRRDAGRSLKDAMKQPAWYFSKERFYRCDRARRIQLGRGSLVRFYYLWLASGKSPSAFRLAYVVKRLPVTRQNLKQFLKVCAMTGTRSMRAAYKRMQPAPRGTFGRAIVAAFSPSIRAAIRKALAERRRLMLRDRQISRIILNLGARL